MADQSRTVTGDVFEVDLTTPMEAEPAEDDLERMAMEFVQSSENAMPTQVQRSVATIMMDPVTPAERRGPKPVVIKGGPRRVVRADGKVPKIEDAQGARRFALTSGHAMFVRPQHTSRLIASLVGIAAIAAIVAVIILAWQWSVSSLRLENEQDMVGTSSYDLGISLTPADDGGYYTAFLVTSTPTDVDQIGDLSQVLLYRTPDRPDAASFSGALIISVPVNLSVSSTTGETTTTVSLADTLADRGVNRALTGISTAFNIRIYNVAVMGQSAFDTVYALLSGQVQASSVDAEGLLGQVRSNLTLQGLVDYAGKIGTAGGSALPMFVAPTTAVESATGAALVAGNPEAFLSTLTATLNPVVDTPEGEGEDGEFVDEGGDGDWAPEFEEGDGDWAPEFEEGVPE